MSQANFSGRTGRIGHRGIATSFFTERDEGMGSVLTRTLLETNQEIPECLEMYLPEGEARTNLKFEADSDFDPNDVAGAGDAGGAAWGTGDGDGGDGGNGGNAWGGGNAGAEGGDAWGSGGGDTGAGSGDAWGSGGGNSDANNWNSAPAASAAW